MDFSVLGRMRAQNPRIHYICNHVTSLDCANLLRLAAERGEARKPHCDRMVYEAVELLEELLAE